MPCLQRELELTRSQSGAYHGQTILPLCQQAAGVLLVPARLATGVLLRPSRLATGVLFSCFPLFLRF